MEFVLVLAALAGVAAVALGRWGLERRRREDLALATRRLGLAYSPVDTLGCLDPPSRSCPPDALG